MDRASSKPGHSEHNRNGDDTVFRGLWTVCALWVFGVVQAIDVVNVLTLGAAQVFAFGARSVGVIRILGVVRSAGVA